MPISLSELDDLVASVQPQLFDWRLDIFAVHRRSGGHSLYVITLALLQHYGLLDGWLVSRPAMQAYLLEVEARYLANPYHNALHAADVTQASAIILNECIRACPGITQLEIFAVILAAAVHDVGHMAVNNDFLINTRHPNAITYNDLSVNENFHISQAFGIAFSDPSRDIFQQFSVQEFKRVRSLMIGVVLATDMSVHFSLMDEFKRQLDAQPSTSNWPDRGLLYRFIVHLADIANPARGFDMARRWAERVVAEFLQQGDKEAEAGLPVTPFCNRRNVNLPRAQTGFIATFLAPALEALAPLTPDFAATSLALLKETAEGWAAQELDGVLAPGADASKALPTLPVRLTHPPPAAAVES